VKAGRLERSLKGAVRKKFGRDASKPLTSMAPPLGSVGRRRSGFGMGSVGRGGSVGPAKLSVPGHNFQLDDLTRVPGIDRGPSMGIDG
jgi:hypothetical protein